MFGRDAIALVDHAELDLVLNGLERHPDRCSGTTIFDRIADQIVQQLADLDAVGPNLWHRTYLDPNAIAVAHARADHARHLLDNRTKRETVLRHRKAIRLDPRQGDQVVDKLLHPLRFGMHDTEEAGSGSGVLGGSAFAQRFDEAQDCCQRRAQLMTGVGDEIDPHPFGHPAFGTVTQRHQQRPASEPPHAHCPAPIRLAEPGQLDRHLGFLVQRDQLGSHRVAQGKAKIALDLFRSEQLARRCVRMGDLVTRDDQYDVVDSVDQLDRAI